GVGVFAVPREFITPDVNAFQLRQQSVELRLVGFAKRDELSQELYLHVVHCYLDALGSADREPVQMVETQSRVLGARHRQPAKKQERQQHGRTACCDRFSIHFSLPGSVPQEVASGASVSEPRRKTLSPPLAALTQSFVVIATARFRHRAFAAELHADLPELAVVFRLAGRMGQPVERLYFIRAAFVRAFKLFFALRAEALAAGLLGQRVELFARDLAILTAAHQTAAPAEKQPDFVVMVLA